MSSLSVSPTVDQSNFNMPPSNPADGKSEEQLISDIIQLLEQLLNSSQAASQGGGIGGGGGAGGGGGGGGDDDGDAMSGMPQMNNMMSTGGGPSGADAGGAGAATNFGDAGGAGDAGTAAPAAGAGSTGAGAAASSLNPAGGSTLGPGFPSQLQPYKSAIENASAQTGVPANILAGQIWDESRGNPNAGSTNVNGMTDAGLMQMDPATFAGLQKEHPDLQGKSLSDPSTNILGGAYYMKDMANQFGGDWSKALRAYNSGPDQVNGNLSNVSVGDPNYVNNVMQYADAIQNGGTLPA